MDKKQRFFIYEGRELLLLFVLAIGVSVFAFTLGVHLGKGLPQAELSHSIHQSDSAVETGEEPSPSRYELTEEAKKGDDEAKELLDKKIYSEVLSTGIRLEKERAVELPESSKGTEHSSDAHSDLKRLKDMANEMKQKHGGDQPPAESAQLAKPAPEGEYTLQVGAFPSIDEAGGRLKKLEAMGVKPFVRPAKINGKSWYRVYIGGYPTMEEAERFGKDYVSKHVIQEFVTKNMPSDQFEEETYDAKGRDH